MIEQNRPPKSTEKPEKTVPLAAQPHEISKETQIADASEGVTPNQLTPEEQMALYEEQLKEDDWGHQPC